MKSRMVGRSSVVSTRASKRKIQTDTAIYFFEGVTHARKEQSTEAITQFNKVIEAEPKYAIPYISGGKAYSAKGQHDKAISAMI